MTITIGWWVIPLIITVVSFGLALRCRDWEAVLYVPVALSISLFVWLVWALFN